MHKFIKQVLEYSIELKPKENILIEIFGDNAKDMIKEFEIQIKNLGANLSYNVYTEKLLRNLIENSSKEDMEEYAKQELKKMKKMDAYVVIRADEKVFNIKNISYEKMKQYNEIYKKKVHYEERCNNTKWCVLGYPNEFSAKNAGMNIEEYTNFYYKVCGLDYKKLSENMHNLEKLMDNTDRVKIISNDINLEFSIKGIKSVKCDGKRNMPDGEVATSPIKNSINGYIKYNTKSIFNGIEFKDVRFEFKDGKIINATANKAEELNKILDIDEGARYIGEFALGLNPYIRKTINDILFDEKINGSFHLTPGNSSGKRDNSNRSAIHWDLIVIQTEEYGGGEIWFDDKLIRKDGIFVIEELNNLNNLNYLK